MKRRGVVLNKNLVKNGTRLARWAEAGMNWADGSLNQGVNVEAGLIDLNNRRMKMKTSIKAISDSVVDIRFADVFTGDVREYRFYAKSDGGYVRYGDGKQICEGLASTGPTLMWSGKEPLVNLIRKEYRAMRRTEKRELANI